MPGHDKPVRVSLVSSHAQLGGSERYLELVLDELSDDSVAVVVALQRGPFTERLRRRSVPLAVVPTPARLGILPAAVRLRRILIAHRSEVVHANGVKAALVAGLAMLGTGVPVLWVKHDTSLDGPIAWTAARLTTRVAGVSRAVLETFGSAHADKLQVIHNGVPDPAVDRAAARSTMTALHGGSREAPVVLLVGRLDPAKGQLDVIEAAPALRVRHPDLRVVFCGGEDAHHPQYARQLRDRAHELGLKDVVLFLGHRDDAVTLIAGSDVVAVPSRPGGNGWREGFGLVGVEAFWVGTPVVAYADGALPEILGECARLVSPGDGDALRDALLMVLGERELRERMIACGRDRAHERYTVDRMVDALRETYRELAAAR